MKFTDIENIKNIYNKKDNENEINDNLDISIDKKKKKKSNRNKKPLKHKIKNRNENMKLNLPGSTKELFINDKIRHKRPHDTNSVIYYRRNKLEESIKRKKEENELSNEEDAKKTDSILNNKKKEKKERLGNMRLKYKKINYAYTYEELNDMDFEEALNNDKRSFARIFISYLLEEHIIFNTFCTDVYLELRSIKLSFLIFGYEINFFLNALFYTDEYISDTYHNDGVLDFFSSLPKSIYSFIVTLVISNLLKMLSSSKKQLNKIIKEIEDKTEYLKAIETELNKFKKKILLYFIIVFILSLFFSYYVSAFCAVYQNSQNFWLFGCLESLALDLVTPFLICLILSISRYIGLKKKNKCSYNSAKYLGILI